MNFASMQSYNVFRSIAENIAQNTQEYKLEDLINRSSGLGREEKEVIFDYVKNGEDYAKSRKEYVTNTIIIFNSFFEYGFLRKSQSSIAGGGVTSSYTDEWADGDDSSQLGKIEHYWEYITMLMRDLDSVRYINFYYEDASTNREKALGWILLALNQQDELKTVLLEIFSNIPILQLYSKEESYLWQNRKEILECVDVIQDKYMYNPCPLLDNFIEFGRKKEEQKEQKQILKLLEPHEIDGEAINKNQDYIDQDLDQTAGFINQEDPKQQTNQQLQFRPNSASGQMINSQSEEQLEKHSDYNSAKGSFAQLQIKNQQSGTNKLNKHATQQSIDSQNVQTVIQQTEHRSSMGSYKEANIGHFKSITDQQARLNLFSSNELLNGQMSQDTSRRTKDQHKFNNSEANQWLLENQTLGNNSSIRNNNELQSNRLLDYSNQKRVEHRDNESLTSQSQYSSQVNNALRKNKIMKQNLQNIQEQQQSVATDESKRYINNIFSEGEVFVPIAQRNQFKMVFQNQNGSKYLEDMKNSEIIYYNEFYEKLKFKEYTFHKKEMFMKKKYIIKQNSSNIDQYCGMCFRKFIKKWILLTDKVFCSFCLDFICSNCATNKNTLIPNEFQLKQTVGKEHICLEAYDFLSKFHYIRIDKYNPILVIDQKLKNLLVLRRKVHKLYDLIKCNKWQSIIEQNEMKQHKNLILRDCYLTFEQASDYKILENVLNYMFQLLLTHIRTCPRCYYMGEKCQICLSNKIIQIFNVEEVSECKQCFKKGHRQCINEHNC